MLALWIIKGLVALGGIYIIIAGLVLTKEKHKNADYSNAAFPGLIGWIIGVIFAVIMRFLPVWVAKIIWITFGVFLLYLVFKPS